MNFFRELSLILITFSTLYAFFRRGATKATTYRRELLYGYANENCLTDRIDLSSIKALFSDTTKVVSMEQARNIINSMDVIIGVEQATMSEKDRIVTTLEVTNLLYSGLQDRELLRGFSSIEGIYPMGYDVVCNITEDELESVTGTTVRALNGKPSSAVPLVLFSIMLESIVSSSLGIDSISVAYPVTFILVCFDQLVCKGAFFDTFYRKVFPEYDRKVIVHEAGHFLVAYLLGLRITDCVTNAWEARKYPEIGGRGGTVFVDWALDSDGSRRLLSEQELVALTVVTMGGIAAEALVYRCAEGGFADEQNLYSLYATAQPPWDSGRIRDQARWAVVQAFLLLKEHEDAFRALITALEKNAKVGDCIIAIEENLPAVLPSETRRKEVEERKRAEAVKEAVFQRYKSKVETPSLTHIDQSSLKHEHVTSSFLDVMARK